jgi:hypothetical protein
MVTLVTNLLTSREWVMNRIEITTNITYQRTRNKYIISAETHFSFGQFIHEEYVSMDATSLRKLLQRGATIYWLSRLWIYHYFEYVDCNIWFLALLSLAKLHPFNAHIWKSPSY